VTCEWNVEQKGSLVRLAGELDIACAPCLATLEESLRDQESVVFDVSGLDYVDATFLSFLIRLAKRINRVDPAIELIGAKPNLLRLLEVTGLSRRFVLSPRTSAA
jgi:anti-sigma B factor antagonist